jgi:hypothetical protein
MPPVKSLGNSRAKYNYKFGLTGFEAALPPPQTEGPIYSDDVFSTDLYEGTGSAQKITNGINLSGKGGLVWLKGRESLSAPYTNLELHCLFDNVRTGATGGSAGGGGRLRTSSDQISQSDTYLDSYDSDGFTLTSTSSVNEASIVNENGKDFVSWSFRKQPGFLDIQQYTGDANNSQVINHNLGCKPGMVIIKRTNGTGGDWAVYFKSGDNDTEVGYGVLNNNNGFTTSNIAFTSNAQYITVYSSSFAIDANADGATYIMYIFAQGGADTDARKFGTNQDESIIKCGTWTASSGAATIDNIGWEPQFVLVKNVTDAGFWGMFDIMRGMPVGGADPYFSAHSDGVESSGTTNFIDPLPNGFKVSNLGSSQTFAYMAIRRPHKPITVPTKLFTVGGNTTSTPEYVSNFVVDMAFHRNLQTNVTDSTGIFSRLTGSGALATNSTAIEAAPNATNQFDFMDGWGDNLANDSNYKSWMFRRAPGFFDAVTYSGQAPNAQSIPHNLGVVPELILIKSRTALASWAVYSSTLGEAKYLMLDDHADETSSTTAWNNTSPTSTTFTVGDLGNTNQNSQDFIAYLFASSPGVSKIGTYSNGSTSVVQNIDCGFNSPARFIMIKRYDTGIASAAHGQWAVWDTVRGIGTGNDSYVSLNTTDAEVTGFDDISTFSSGFTVNVEGANTSGYFNVANASYIYLAIA